MRLLALVYGLERPASGSKGRRLQTTCILRSKELDLPHFRLCARKGRNLRPLPEVAVQDHSDFSRNLFLSGEDTGKILQLFKPWLCDGLVRVFECLLHLGRKRMDRLTSIVLYLTISNGQCELEALGNTMAIHLRSIIDPLCASDLIALADETKELFIKSQTSLKGDA